MRRAGACPICSRVEKPPLRAFDCQRRQDTCAIGTSVDSDAVGSLVDIPRNGVAMDDYEAMVAVIRKERITNPAQVGLKLLLNFNSRADACMDEQIITEAAAIDKTFEEFDMTCGNGGLCKFNYRFRQPTSKLRRLDAVTFEALQSAKLKPAGDQRSISTKDAQQYFLVVSKEEDCLDARSILVSKPLDDLR